MKLGFKEITVNEGTITIKDRIHIYRIFGRVWLLLLIIFTAQNIFVPNLKITTDPSFLWFAWLLRVLALMYAVYLSFFLPRLIITISTDEQTISDKNGKHALKALTCHYRKDFISTEIQFRSSNGFILYSISTNRPDQMEPFLRLLAQAGIHPINAPALTV